VTDSLVPDLVARYSMMGQDSQLALVAILRQLEVDGTPVSNFGAPENPETGSPISPTVDETEAGYGLGFSGNMKVGNATDFKFMVMGGSGVGRYTGMAFNPDVIVEDDGSGMEAVDHIGFNFGIAHRLNKIGVPMSGSVWRKLTLMARNCQRTPGVVRPTSCTPLRLP